MVELELRLFPRLGALAVSVFLIPRTGTFLIPRHGDSCLESSSVKPGGRVGPVDTSPLDVQVWLADSDFPYSQSRVFV